MPSSPFADLANATERIAAAAGRHEKADVLGAYLHTLGDADVARAARFAAGRVFPLHDQRTASVGGAALLRALAAVTGEEADALRPRVVALGGVAEAVGEAMAAHADRLAPEPFTLADADAFFATLAATSGTHARADLLRDRLARVTPAEGRLLAALLGGDLRIGLQEGGVEGALVRAFEVPLADVRRAHMLTGDVGETAVLARAGRLAEARLRAFHPVRFMLATAADGADDVARQMPEAFAVEDKFDGIRAQAHVAADPGDSTLHGVTLGDARVALFSRTLDAVTPAFPDLVTPLAALAALAPGGLILDGEIVPVDGATSRPFQALQRRLGRKSPTDAVQQEVPVAYVVYDVLLMDGAPLLDAPYEARQRALDGLALALADAPSDAVRRSAVSLLSPDALDAAFDAARARGNEGLMVKAPASPYVPGRRGRDWLKVKKALATLDCVVTSVEVGNGKRRHLLSDFTFAVRAADDDPTLLNVGKAYSGLTDKELETLTAWFEAHTLQTFAHGKVRVVEPGVVVEVAFDRVQPSPRHKSGFALRFPRIVRLRDDKPVEEIDTLAAVRAIWEAEGVKDEG